MTRTDWLSTSLRILRRRPKWQYALAGVVLLLLGSVAFSRIAGDRIARHELQLLLPAVGLYAPAAIHRDFYDVYFKPKSDPELAFHVLVPRTWSERPLDAAQQESRKEDREPVTLVSLSPTDRNDALLEVSYLRPQHPASLQQYMNEHVRRLHARILARQPGSFNDRKVEDALLSQQHPVLGPCLTRVTISRHGDYLFIVSGSVPKSRYEEMRSILGAAAVSFAPGGVQSAANTPPPSPTN